MLLFFSERLLSYALLVVSFVIALITVAFAAPPVEQPACTGSSGFTVVDSSIQVTKLVAENNEPGLSALKGYGVRTIFRYYDLPTESIACKTLLPSETDAIFAARAGFKIGVVFQHASDDPNTFIADPRTAETHALRALDLAAANGQPKDSAIYFGVDGADLHLEDVALMYKKRDGRELSDSEIAALRSNHQGPLVRWYSNFLIYRARAFGSNEPITAESLYPFVKNYFDTISRVFANRAATEPDRSYKIGIYCTAALCDYAERKHLADYFWVTAEGRNKPTYARFVNKNTWHMLQQLETLCPKWPRPRNAGFDFNRISERGIGDWSASARRTPIERPTTCLQD
jgi:hypothetical protein